MDVDHESSSALPYKERATQHHNNSATSPVITDCMRSEVLSGIAEVPLRRHWFGALRQESTVLHGRSTFLSSPDSRRNVSTSSSGHPAVSHRASSKCSECACQRFLQSISVIDVYTRGDAPISWRYVVLDAIVFTTTNVCRAHLSWLFTQVGTCLFDAVGSRQKPPRFY